jgi:4-carboxymuconolactone decarboxylase
MEVQMRRLTTLPMIFVLGISLGAQSSSPPTAPRISPLAEDQWSEDIRAVSSSANRGGRATNDFKTFAQHPELLKGIAPLTTYLARELTLAPRERELLVLRTAWLCHAQYVWAQHAAVARETGFSAEDIHRIAEGPDAKGWNPFEATLLRMADELHVNAFITDATWNALSARYDRPHMMDALTTVAQYTMLSVAMNAFGVPLEANLTARLPTDVRYNPVAAKLSEPQIRLSQPRVPPLGPSEWTPEVRAMLDPENSGRPVSTLFQILAQHQKQYPSRFVLSEYLRLKTTLMASEQRARELVILRTAWLCRSRYEWSAQEQVARRIGMTDAEIHGIVEGPDARVWNSADATLLRVADELYHDATLSDATWNKLGEHFTAQQRMDLVITAGGYRLVAMTVSGLGVPLEPGARPFP